MVQIGAKCFQSSAPLGPRGEMKRCLCVYADDTQLYVRGGPPTACAKPFAIRFGRGATFKAHRRTCADSSHCLLFICLCFWIFDRARNLFIASRLSYRNRCATCLDQRQLAQIQFLIKKLLCSEFQRFFFTNDTSRHGENLWNVTFYRCIFYFLFCRSDDLTVCKL